MSDLILIVMGVYLAGLIIVPAALGYLGKNNSDEVFFFSVLWPISTTAAVFTIVFRYILAHSYRMGQKLRKKAVSDE